MGFKHAGQLGLVSHDASPLKTYPGAERGLQAVQNRWNLKSLDLQALTKPKGGALISDHKPADRNALPRNEAGGARHQRQLE